MGNVQRDRRTDLAKILAQARRAQTRLDEHGKNLGMLAEMDRQQDDQNSEEAEQEKKNIKKTPRYQDENLIDSLAK